MSFHREIVFYDYDFNTIGTAFRAADIYHKELYNSVGTFEAELDLSESVCAQLLKRDYVVAVWDSLAAIVTAVKSVDGEGTLKIYGRTPNWLLSRRVCPGFDCRTGTPFALAHALVDEIWGDGIDVGTGSDIAAEDIEFWRGGPNQLDEVVEDCLDKASGGHRIVFDTKNKQWRFETFKGTESKIVFSFDRKNVSEMSFSRSVLDYFNGGSYYNDETNEWTEIESEKEGIYKWTTRLDSSDESSAQSELGKMKIENKIELTPIEVFRLSGCQLGDTVGVMHECGGEKLTKKLRVVGIERWAGYNSFGERPLLDEIGSE